MAEITQEAIDEAINNCSWRVIVHDVPICTGNCGACQVEIERGRCDTLKQLFAKSQRSDSVDT